MNNSLMINWEEQLIFCNSCGRWISGRDIWIDGTHDFRGKLERSAHTIWEK